MSVEKIKSLDDLKWIEPGKQQNENNNNDNDDIKIPSNDNQPPPQQQPSEPEQKQPSQPLEQSKPVSIPISQPKPQPIAVQPQQPVQEIIYTEWDCPKCSAVNDMAYKFCPKCGCNKESWKPPVKPNPFPIAVPNPVQDEAKKPAESEMNDNEEAASGSGVISDKNKDEINEILLKKVSIINDGVFQPNEKRQTGWIVRNISGKQIDVKAKLVKIGGDSDVVLKYEDQFHFNIDPNGEMFILLEVSLCFKLP